MKILMVLTSHDKLGNTGRKTGYWFEELAAPYYTFKDAGAEVVLASPSAPLPDDYPYGRFGVLQRERYIDSSEQALREL